MEKLNRVLIVGGGIAGLVAAKLLGERNIEVEIAEIKQEWTVYGVGIIQQCNVVRAMSQIDLLDRYLDAAFAFDDVGMYSTGGELVARIPGQRLAGPEYPANVGITRVALHEVLTTAAKEAGTVVHLGTSVTALTPSADKVEVTFTDGRQESFDLVIGADGIYSKVRELVFPDAPKPRYTGQGGWRHNFPRPPELDHLVSYHAGRYGSAGLVPLASDLMYVYMTSKEPGNPWMAPDQLHELMRERLQDFGGMLAELREQITDPTQVVYKPFEVVEMEGPWHKGRIILIGDAAHASTPHLGQGGGMAIEDAVVLVDELEKKASVEQAFEGFMERRYERCRFLQRMALSVGEAEMNRDPDFNFIDTVRRMMEAAAAPV